MRQTPLDERSRLTALVAAWFMLVSLATQPVIEGTGFSAPAPGEQCLDVRAGVPDETDGIELDLSCFPKWDPLVFPPAVISYVIPQLTARYSGHIDSSHCARGPPTQVS